MPAAPVYHRLEPMAVQHAAAVTLLEVHDQAVGSPRDSRAFLLNHRKPPGLEKGRNG